MKSHLPIFVAWLLGCSAFAPSVDARTAHEDLVISAAQLESIANAEGRSSPDVSALDRIDARLVALDPEVVGEPALHAKHAAVEGLAWLVRHGRIARTANASERAAPVARIDGLAGASCEAAIELPVESTSRHAARQGDVLWFKVSAVGNDPLLLSTRGSTVDPVLDVFEDCRATKRPPILRVDDTFGLQADVPLKHDNRTFWLVKATILAGTGELSATTGTGVWFEGRVTDELTGAPLAGVAVAVHRVTNGSTMFAASGFTGVDGRYAVGAGTGPGTYAIRTGDATGSSPLIHEAHSNFPCLVQQLWDYLSCGPAPGSYTPINVTGSATTFIDFALQQGGVLTGTITSGTGGPVEFAQVRLRDTTGLYDRATTTDGLGRYRIVGVPPVSLRLEASSFNHALTMHQGLDCAAFASGICPFELGTPVVLPPRSQARIDMMLRRLPFIEVIPTIDGQSLTTLPQNVALSVTVAALDAAGNTLASASATPFDPRARIGPLPTGTYYVRATSNRTVPQLYPAVTCASDCSAEIPQATAVPVSSGSGNLSLAMDLESLPRIAGRLTEEGTGLPIDQATVRLVRTDGADWYSSITAAGGYYLFGAVPLGQYHLRFASERHIDEAHNDIVCLNTNNTALCPGSTLITIDRSTNDLTIDAVLRRSSVLTGRVLRDGSGGLASITFDLLTPSGTVVASWNTSTATAGSYVLQDVPPGSWLLAARSGIDAFPQLYRGIDCVNSNGFSLTGCPFEQATLLQVPAQSTSSGIDFSLRFRSTQLLRVVDNETGAPIQGVSIDVWDSAGRHVSTSLSDSGGRAFARPNDFATAIYALSTDNALGYRDEVFDNIECAVGSAYRGTCPLTGYTPVTLPANATAPAIVIGLSRRDELFVDGFESR